VVVCRGADPRREHRGEPAPCPRGHAFARDTHARVRYGLGHHHRQGIAQRDHRGGGGGRREGKTVRTDIEGHYSIKLPEGSYGLRIFAPSYKSLRLKDLAVKAGQATKTDVAMEGAGAAGVDVVEVRAQRKKAAEASQLQARKEAPVVQDSIGRESMAKSTGSEVGALVKRAPCRHGEGRQVHLRPGAQRALFERAS
jgi:hypothetical protein